MFFCPFTPSPLNYSPMYTYMHTIKSCSFRSGHILQSRASAHGTRRLAYPLSNAISNRHQMADSGALSSSPGNPVAATQPPPRATPSQSNEAPIPGQ